MKEIKSALISVFNKDGIANIVEHLIKNNITIYSTGGTQAFIESLGGTVVAVEDITSYPSILDGRVKTLHPKVFGGILARREADHLGQLEQYEIPEIDLVIVDLYPFEDTVASTTDEAQIIEKIDIGGISLIRAAAKNYKDVVVVPSKEEYSYLENILAQGTSTSLAQRKELALRAFAVSSHYDTAIHDYFASDKDLTSPKFGISHMQSKELRYGENPHQSATFYGNIDAIFTNHGQKNLSFNNLVDVDAAMNLMAEFADTKPTFAVLKHTNVCGIATRSSVLDAWTDALAGDPVSAFGGILISNTKIDLATAKEINKIFYEVIIAPEFDEEAKQLLASKKNRAVLTTNDGYSLKTAYKSILNGVVRQDYDAKVESSDDLKLVTKVAPSQEEINDLLFANKIAKHLKSNTIVIAKNNQLLGMGCGQTSRVDACHQAIAKAARMGFDIKGAAMASDAFFPFPDCVEIAHNHGIDTVIQPGGSIKDNLSIEYCNNNGMKMVFTGIRHFKH